MMRKKTIAKNYRGKNKDLEMLNWNTSLCDANLYGVVLCCILCQTTEVGMRKYVEKKITRLTLHYLN